MPDGAVICIDCGYDKRTGRRVNDGPAPSKKNLAFKSAVLAVALLLAARFYFAAKAPPPLPPRPVATAQQPVVAAALAALPATPAVAATSAVPAEPKVDTNELARAENAAREAARREQFRRQVDDKFPMFVPGEQVVLRMTNAVVRRGVFKRNEATAVVLGVAGNEEAAVPFVSLDRGTRLRCDTNFRLEYEDYWIEKAGTDH